MKKISLYLMACFYVIAGINHFVSTPSYMGIMPPYLPFPLTLVYIAGVCEIVFGLLLIPVLTRKLAAWLLIILLVAIFPANIQMALNYWRPHNPQLWIAIARLPVQALLIAWAYTYTRPNYTVVPL
jgi:uncharacterized membrane protein